MIENLKELNEKVNLFVDYVVKKACESTTSGSYYVNVNEALNVAGMGYDDFLEYRELIHGELFSREEVLDLDYLETEEEFDISCALDYCPNYQWTMGDEDVFDCSYEEWLERPVKPVAQLSSVDELNSSDLKKWMYVDKKCEEDSEYQKLSETYEAALQSDNYDTQDYCYAEMGRIRDEYAAEFDALPQPSVPDVYFTVRDMFGDDIGDKIFPTFDEALKALKVYCSQSADVSDNAMLGIVCKAEDKIHKCVLVQNQVNRHGESVLKPMHDNILREALAVPQIELASLRAKQIQYPFDETTQKRIDALEKMLGIYDRDVDVSGDLYVGKWRVHIVAPGARYGLNNRLTNEESRSLLEFWDMSPKKGDFPNGQFVSRYDVETLLGYKWGPGPEAHMRSGLCLDVGNADVWSVTANEMTKVFEWLKNRDFLPGEHYLEYHCDIDIIDVRFSVLTEDFIHEKLSSIAQVRDIQNIECFGQSNNDGCGYSFSFKTQADAKSVEKAFSKTFENGLYTLAHEEKVVEREKQRLDKVISSCEKMSKESKCRDNKEKGIDKDER